MLTIKGIPYKVFAYELDIVSNDLNNKFRKECSIMNVSGRAMSLNRKSQTYITNGGFEDKLYHLLIHELLYFHGPKKPQLYLI